MRKQSLKTWLPRGRQLAGVAAVMTLALMSAFVHVVAKGLNDGGQRRATLDLQDQRLRQCNALPHTEQRLDCLRVLPGAQRLQLATGPLT